MPRKRVADKQIAFALRQAEAGTTVGEICRMMGAAEATVYRWKTVDVGMMVSQGCRGVFSLFECPACRSVRRPTGEDTHPPLGALGGYSTDTARGAIQPCSCGRGRR